MTTRLTALLLTMSFLAALCVPVPSPGCAIAPRMGERVEMADESAIIIWDAASKQQHFIRRASFATGSTVKDFGFLVPTPSYPELAEASDEAFTTLEKVTAPRTVTERKPVVLVPNLGCSSEMEAKKDVTVLQETRVAGYDAVVLEAKSADALSRWLSEHGYEFAKDLREWVEPYVQKGWKVTAFKVARDASGKRLATSAVRMTFATDKPYFPYREPPQHPRVDGRRLRVYFLADARYKGVLQDSRWQARVPWANVVDESSRTAVLEQLKLSEDVVPPKWWLTEFEDTASSRPGNDDVTFQPDLLQQTAEREPHVVQVEPTLVDYPLAFLTQCWCCYSPFLLLGLVLWMTRGLNHKDQSKSN